MTESPSRGLYQRPRCHGPSGGPGWCSACLADGGLIEWLPEDWDWAAETREPEADIEAAMRYMQARLGYDGPG